MERAALRARLIKERMEKQAGLWIDHRKTVIVFIGDDGKEEIKEINSHMEKHVRFGGGADEHGEGEDVRDREFGNHLNTYYDGIVALIKDTKTIDIFGPGEAKGELEKRLKAKGYRGHILPIETVDKMTDGQIAAKVRKDLASAL